MAKVKFYYGGMGCSKTANALMTRFQYEDRGQSVWLIKPATDNRDDLKHKDGTVTTIVKSRVGIQAEAETVDSTASIVSLLLKKVQFCPDVIICDEAQFLTETQVDELRDLASNKNIQVLCYGLRTDFQSHLFSGSRRLFEVADKLVELDSICECGEHAIVNAKFNSSGKLITSGSQIDIGGDDKYKALCWRCYRTKLNNSATTK